MEELQKRDLGLEIYGDRSPEMHLKQHRRTDRCIRRRKADERLHASASPSCTRLKVAFVR